ncbi:MAG: homoserine O-succinyltransferase [Oscillospiraceae bacterium]|nr:homoserine O-succinyltransferase [Oscillospiraceae bacterium]
MPIRLPEDLPAHSILESENIFVMKEGRAATQNIRPLKLLILNLMPDKITTETQLLRKLSNTPLQIEVDLLCTESYTPTHTDATHLNTFYTNFSQIRQKRYDGMIITGAPVEHLAFEEVTYWPELCEIMEWSKKHVHSTLHICWGSQAGLYYHYGIQKHSYKNKISGVFAHSVLDPHEPIFRGFDDIFYVPHSRYTGVTASEIAACSQLRLLSTSAEAGVYLVASKDGRQIFISGHPEYDACTLSNEYHRDLEKGINPSLPQHYFPNDNPDNPPIVMWRSYAQLLYTNWLNYYVYQTTPYDLDKLEKE